MNDLPFASEPAELSYQAFLETGVVCTRDQFRVAIQKFVLEDERSRKNYEEFKQRRERDEL